MSARYALRRGRWGSGKKPDGAEREIANSTLLALAKSIIFREAFFEGGGLDGSGYRLWKIAQTARVVQAGAIAALAIAFGHEFTQSLSPGEYAW